MLQNLKFLDLNRNPISRVGPGDFQDLLHLEELRWVVRVRVVRVWCGGRVVLGWC